MVVVGRFGSLGSFGDLCLIGCLIPCLHAGGDNLHCVHPDLLLVLRVVGDTLVEQRVLEVPAELVHIGLAPVSLGDPLGPPGFGHYPPVVPVPIGT